MPRISIAQCFFPINHCINLHYQHEWNKKMQQFISATTSCSRLKHRSIDSVVASFQTDINWMRTDTGTV